MNIDEKITELETQLEACCNKIKTKIEALKAEIKPKVKDLVGYYRPPECGDYYFLTWDWRVEKSFYSNTFCDKIYQKYGNSFETKEQAERKRDRDEAIGILKREIKEINAGVVVDWKDNNQHKYFLYYDHRTQVFSTTGREVIQDKDSELYCLDVDKLHAWANANEKPAKLALGII